MIGDSISKHAKGLQLQVVNDVSKDGSVFWPSNLDPSFIRGDVDIGFLQQREAFAIRGRCNKGTDLTV